MTQEPIESDQERTLAHDILEDVKTCLERLKKLEQDLQNLRSDQTAAAAETESKLKAEITTLRETIQSLHAELKTLRTSEGLPSTATEDQNSPNSPESNQSPETPEPEPVRVENTPVATPKRFRRI